MDACTGNDIHYIIIQCIFTKGTNVPLTVTETDDIFFYFFIINYRHEKW